MAPRSTKAKKTAEIKISNTEAPTKSRSKLTAKKIKELEEESSEKVEAIAPETEKKTCEKKELNGYVEQNVPPVKKGRKKKEPTPGQIEISDEAIPKDIGTYGVGDQPETNSISEVPAINGKGRNRPTKKQTGGEDDSNESTNNKKSAKQQSDNEESVPKATKGRGRKAQPKTEPAPVEILHEEVKSEPVVKGKKKGVAKGGKGKDIVNMQEAEQEETEISKAPQEKSKAGRGRKNQTKNIQDKKKENKPVDIHSENNQEPAAKKIKLEEGKDETKEEDTTEAKSTKGKRGRKPAKAAPEGQELEDIGETSIKRRRKPNEEKDNNKKNVSPKNKKSTDYESIMFSNASKNAQDKEWNFKICSWNVDGIRAWLGKGGLDYIKYEKPDILCLQEVKCSREKLPQEIANVPGYHAYWLCSDQDGYAGVGIYTTKLAMNVQYGLQDEELDSEGRIITAEYEQFYLICTYVPNAGRKLVTLPKRLQWNEAFHKYVKELDKKKPVIICGDMNVAHNEIDLANPKSNRKNAGFTEEERSGMTNLLKDGFVDTFRHFYPDKPNSYTFWTYMMNSRAKNVGWRLDYFIVSEKLLPSVCDNTIRNQVYGSDHCPITLFLHLTSADKPKQEN